MMGRGQKIFTTVLWGLTVVMMLVMVGAGLWVKRHAGTVESPYASPESHSFPVPAFALTDQMGNSIDEQSLHGSVWVANFIFTNCAGPCPKMTAMMAEFQRRVARSDVKIVSFTVDPKRDTPQVLRAYGEKFGADPSRWHFLTGTIEQMDDVARGMKIAAERTHEDNITHGTYFLLVDRDGKVRGIYRQSDPNEIDRLSADAVALADQSREARP